MGHRSIGALSGRFSGRVVTLAIAFALATSLLFTAGCGGGGGGTATGPTEPSRLVVNPGNGTLLGTIVWDGVTMSPEEVTTKVMNLKTNDRVPWQYSQSTGGNTTFYSWGIMLITKGNAVGGVEIEFLGPNRDTVLVNVPDVTNNGVQIQFGGQIFSYNLSVQSELNGFIAKMTEIVGQATNGTGRASTDQTMASALGAVIRGLFNHPIVVK